MPQLVDPLIQRKAIRNPQVVLVNRTQNVDKVVKNVQQNLRGYNNLAHMVKDIFAQNGLDVGLHRPNFVSALSEFVLQTEFPM